MVYCNGIKKNTINILLSVSDILIEEITRKGKFMDNNMNRPPVNGGGDKNQRKNTIATIVITLIVA